MRLFRVTFISRKAVPVWNWEIDELLDVSEICAVPEEGCFLIMQAPFSICNILSSLDYIERATAMLD